MGRIVVYKILIDLNTVGIALIRQVVVSQPVVQQVVIGLAPFRGNHAINCSRTTGTRRHQGENPESIVNQCLSSPIQRRKAVRLSVVVIKHGQKSVARLTKLILLVLAPTFHVDSLALQIGSGI